MRRKRAGTGAGAKAILMATPAKRAGAAAVTADTECYYITEARSNSIAAEPSPEPELFRKDRVASTVNGAVIIRT